MRLFSPLARRLYTTYPISAFLAAGFAISTCWATDIDTNVPATAVPATKVFEAKALETIAPETKVSAPATQANTQPAEQIEHHPIEQPLACLHSKAAALAASPTIIAAVQTYNEQPPSSITDKQWASLEAQATTVTALTQTPAAREMQTVITEASWQGEGILMGADGGLVAITEKTTDFWQHDESQFSEAIHLQPGEIYSQKKVVDESTKLMLIKISTPVWDTDNKKAIGVLMIGLDQFVLEFNPPCAN